MRWLWLADGPGASPALRFNGSISGPITACSKTENAGIFVPGGPCGPWGPVNFPRGSGTGPFRSAKSIWGPEPGRNASRDRRRDPHGLRTARPTGARRSSNKRPQRVASVARVTEGVMCSLMYFVNRVGGQERVVVRTWAHPSCSMADRLDGGCKRRRSRRRRISMPRGGDHPVGGRAAPRRGWAWRGGGGVRPDARARRATRPLCGLVLGCCADYGDKIGLFRASCSGCRAHSNSPRLVRRDAAVDALGGPSVVRCICCPYVSPQQESAPTDPARVVDPRHWHFALRRVVPIANSWSRGPGESLAPLLAGRAGANVTEENLQFTRPRTF